MKTIRTKLGWTLVHTARMLGYTGKAGAQWLFNIEVGVGGRHLDYAKANLLLAIAEGYTPVGYVEDKEAEGDEPPASSARKVSAAD